MRVAETRKKNYKAYEENQKNCCSDSIFHMEYKDFPFHKDKNVHQ